MTGLQVRDVSYNYNRTDFCLKNINISAANGEIVCLLGPSGCGKSTILKLIAGLERLQAGSIVVNDKILSDDDVFISPEKRNISLIFQHPSLFPHQTALENVAFAIKYLPKKQRFSIARDILESVGIADHANSYPHMMSGGQQQLVTIARAIAQKPAIVLLDEPFSNLDVVLKHRTREHILSLLKERNVATVVVTHDPEEALTIANTVYVIRAGEVVQSGTPYEIYYYPKDYLLALSFGEINHISAVVQNSAINSPFGSIPAKGFSNKDTVIIGIRPDAILLSEQGMVEAVVKDIKFFNKIVYVEVEGSIYSMKYPVSLLPSRGDKISLSLDISKVLLFKV